MVSRRHFIAHTAPLTLAPWLAGCAADHGPSDGDDRQSPPLPEGTRFSFRHGVASGDPLPDAVILWTRVTREPPDTMPTSATPAMDGDGPSGGAAELAVRYRVALDAELSEMVLEGQAHTDATVDYTVKVDASGLAPATTYYYQFLLGDAVSPVGRTRTAPVGHVERLRIAVTSCANYPQGFFHAYRKIAERPDLDLVLYLGDYIYEYGNRSYGNGAPLGRVPDPDHEIVSLDDYRRRHAQYKLDADLQEVHRQHPAVVVWDDHEIADNAYRTGADNHQPDADGSWDLRYQAAVRAYHEWMPMRSLGPADSPRIYRRFAFGDLMDLIMLDTRLIGRDRHVDDPCAAEVNDPSRSLLGAEQEAWFASELVGSKQRGTRWRLVGQQVAFAQFREESGCSGSVDKWSAYGATRERVLDAIEAGGIDNVVILTGDAHSSWGFDIARDPFDPAVYDPASGRGSLAVELIGPAITSPTISDPVEAAASEQRYKATHPHLHFAEHHRQGYFVVDVTHEQARAQWYFVSPVREPAALESTGGALVTLSGKNHLTPA